VELAVRHPERADELHVDEEEIASWRDAADKSSSRGTRSCRSPAVEGFTRQRKWDFESTRPDQYPLLLNFHNYALYSSQVIKQADLAFALYEFPERFTAKQKARDFAYYERITVRDSSLSASIQGIVAADVGQVELAYDYLAETAFIDLHDLAANTEDGVHLAALSGAWLVVVAGFGGMRDNAETLSFAPRLPGRLSRLAFGMVYRGGG
jgi:alpha,alpha-trehalose phosphorylase